MPAKFTPSEVSRDSVQVVLRDKTSISPDCSAVKRSLADSGTYFTLVGSLKTAAAMARQMSTSKPAQLPLSSGAEKPGRPELTPQDSMPRSLTVFRVCAEAACAESPAMARVQSRIARFMAKPFKDVRSIGLIAAPKGQPNDPDGPRKARPDLESVKAGPLIGQFTGIRGRPLDRQRGTARYHRTIRQRGQGVDGDLPGPVRWGIRASSPAGRPAPSGYGQLLPPATDP